MTDVIGSFELFDRQSKTYVPATIVSPLGSVQAADFKSHWKPEFQQHLKTAYSPEELEAAQLQDSHWKWPEKIAAGAGNIAYASFAVMADGKTQGMMFVNLVKHCRLEEQKGKPLAYVHLVSSAPWNRPALTAKPRFKGVGSALIGAAVSLSIDEGFKGRTGLHALPQSTSWYRDKCKMTDLGPDTRVVGMHYFEMTEAQAQAFLNAP